MPVAISSAANKADIQTQLRNIDISVPLRTNGRTNNQTEIRTICRLLATLAEKDIVSYPISVEHRERPDFLVQFGDKQIGIEVTEAVPEQYAAYSALAAREFPDVFLEPGHFRWGQEKRSPEEMRNLLRQNRLSAPPWMGDSAEREWALYIQSVVESKLTKLAKPGFAHFSENWLSIDDNLPMVHADDLEKAISFLIPTLVPYWTRSPNFSAIYIDHGPVIAMLSQSGASHLPLCDLW